MRLLGWLIVAVVVNSSCTRVGSIAVQTPVPPINFVNAIEAMKRSVIPIVCVQVNGTEAQILSVEGTGFFVAGDGAFLTADHVIGGIVSPQRRTPCPLSAFYLPQSGSWAMERTHATFRNDIFPFAVEACVRNAEVDLARCRSNRELTQAHNVLPVVFESSLQDDGIPIAFTGFPLQYQFPITSTTTLAGYGDVNGDLGPTTVIMANIAWPGASGSPIYTVNGKVVGMVRARGTGDAEGISFGRAATAIQRFLTEADRKNQSQN